MVFEIPGGGMVFTIPIPPAQGPMGPPGLQGAPGSSGPLEAYPATSRVHGAAAPNGGKDTSLVYPGLGQGFLGGFWQTAGAGVLGAVAEEADAGKQVSYFSAGFFDDAPPNDQTIDFYGAVPDSFATFSGDLELLAKYVAETGPSPVVQTLTLDLYDPATGLVVASATRVLPAGGPFEPAYVPLTITQAALNAVGFAAGDLFHLRLWAPVSAVGAGEIKTVRFSRLTIPWA